jgi:hypothetical protein
MNKLEHKVAELEASVIKLKQELNRRTNRVNLIKNVINHATIVFGIMFMTLVVSADTIDQLHVFSSGDVISSSKINDNFNLLNNKINSLSSTITPEFVAVGGGGSILISENGDDWDDISITGSDWKSIEKINNNYFLFSSSRNFISSDGVNWTRIRDGGQSGVHLFLHQNKYHYFLPSNLQVIQHDDIYHFLQPANLIISKEQADSTNFYMNENLIFSTTDGGVHYSNNLSEWEFVSIQQNAEFLDMLYLNGKYILVGHIASSGIIYTSQNGINWSQSHYAITSEYTNFTKILLVENKIFVLGNGVIVVSFDEGSSWQEKQMGQSNDITYYDSNYYVAGDGIYQSTDGINWDQVYSNDNYQSIISNTNIIIAVNHNGFILSSSDGLNWNTEISISQPLNDIIKITSN